MTYSSEYRPVEGVSVLAVYPGTFDPFTLGHDDMVRRACRMFGRVVVAVAAGHHKKTLFTLEERLLMVQQALADVPNVSVGSFDGLVRDFVRTHGAQVMVRGLRGGIDLDYEQQLAGMNLHLMPEVETVFLLPQPRYQAISSTLVREVAALGGPGEAGQFVPPVVLQWLRQKLGR